MVSVYSAELRVVEQSFVFVDSESVFAFLQKHEFLAPIVVDAHGRIRAYFPSSQLFLSVVVDPEVIPTDSMPGDVDLLVLSIATHLDPADAVVKLDQLDTDWWLDALPQTKGKLSINLEFQ